jgi:hypothetical protein
LGKNPSQQAIDMLAKTIHTGFSRQKNLVVTYDRASTWPGEVAVTTARIITARLARLYAERQ